MPRYPRRPAVRPGVTAGPGWSPNDRDHRKITVVDGRAGFTGGVNLDIAYENPPSAGSPPDGNTRNAYWRDVAVRIEGPAVVGEPMRELEARVSQYWM